MKANNMMILDFIGDQDVLFHIPVYQRNYDWSEKNCNRLLDDIENILDKNKNTNTTQNKHFLGNIVYIVSNENDRFLPKCIIIDGQQRLTTLMIFLKALADIAKDKNPVHDDINKYLQNQKHDKVLKLKSSKSDNDQFVALLENKFKEMNKEGHIWLNYDLAKNRFENFVKNKYSVMDILTALQHLEIVYIELEEKEDDPQVIFESLNSTGLDLSNADLIRNFLLMNDPDQEKLYGIWLDIEKLLKSGTDYSNLNLFFMQYVIYKTITPVKEEQLYDHFVKFYNNERGNNEKYKKENILKELKYYAEIFQAFVYDSERYSVPVCKMLRSIRLLKQTTCYPFLFHIFHDFEQKKINPETLEKTLKLILTYLIRRSVCGVPTSSLRRFFTSLYNRVFKIETNKEKYYESINKFLHMVSSKDIFPSESAFKHSLQEAKIYTNGSLCKFLLMDIENRDGKETLDAKNLTIEHIMPRNLSVGWSHISKEEHENYLDVLGNLSLTGYNPELSNKSFKEKKLLFKESKATVLNSDVCNQEAWTVDTIKKRGERLADIILQRYRVEQVDDASIKFEPLREITLDQFKSVTNKKLVEFKFAGKIYHQNKYAGMLQKMLELLDGHHPNVLETLAIATFALKSAPLVSKSGTAMHSPVEFKPGIFIESNLSSDSVIRIIDVLLEKFHEDKSQFSFSINAEETDDESDENDDEQ